MDPIERQAAIDALYDWSEHSMTDAEAWHIRQVIGDIKSMPSAQPERKKGEWIELTNTNHTYVCSVCGRMLVNITDGKNKVAKNYPFCHCGADMRGNNDA